ncbi:MAG: hypothetical protein WC527_07850 [Candidatus Margulisiibacteriota bacterium]
MIPSINVSAGSNTSANYPKVSRRYPEPGERTYLAKVDPSHPNWAGREIKTREDIKKFLDLVSPISECTHNNDFVKAREILEKIKPQLRPETYTLILNDINTQEKAGPATRLIREGKMKEAAIEIKKLRENLSKEDFDKMIVKYDLLLNMKVYEHLAKNDLDGAVDLVDEIRNAFTGNEFANTIDQFDSELTLLRLAKPAFDALFNGDIPKAIEEIDKIKSQLPKVLLDRFYMMLNEAVQKP